MHSNFLVKILRPIAERVMSRPADQIIGPASDPYLLRWRLLPKGPWPNIYFHEFRRSDDARALHDHPTDNVSVILEGRYFEIFGEATIDLETYWYKFPKSKIRTTGDVVARLAGTPHRIALIDTPWGPEIVRTAFICGPRRRNWGFHCPGRGWVKWQDFVKVTPTGNELGKGCEP